MSQNLKKLYTSGNYTQAETIKNTEIKSNAVLFQTVEKWGTKHKSFITRGYYLNRYHKMP